MTPPTSETPILVTTITSAPSAHKQTTTHWTAESIRECFGEDDPSSLVLALLNKLEQSETRLRAAEAELSRCNRVMDDEEREAVARLAKLESERDEARATIATLIRQLEEAQRDADRYRWLRGDGGPSSLRWQRWCVQHWTGHWNPVSELEMEEAIDAAMKDDTHGNG